MNWCLDVLSGDKRGWVIVSGSDRRSIVGAVTGHILVKRPMARGGVPCDCCACRGEIATNQSLLRLLCSQTGVNAHVFG